MPPNWLRLSCGTGRPLRSLKNEFDARLLVRLKPKTFPWNRFVPDQQIRSTVSDHGTVTLTGTVYTLAQRDEAERVVRELAGVRYVSNQITVEGPAVATGALYETIKQALERHVAREAERITVDVQGDTVVLSGGVASWRERRAVLGAAKGTPGVRRIDDQLRIQG